MSTIGEREAAAKAASLKAYQDIEKLADEKKAADAKREREDRADLVKVIGCGVLCIAVCLGALFGVVYLVVLAVRLAWGVS